MADLLAFSAEQVKRLTGLSVRQLQYWDRTDVYHARYIVPEVRGSARLVYTFEDVVGLRTLALLRKRFRISLQELRKVSKWLNAHYGQPWSSLRFYVAGRTVAFDDPETGLQISASHPGQIVLPIALDPIVVQVRKGAERLRERSADEIGRITKSRYVVHNEPVIAGTRIPVDAIRSFHEAGYSVEGIIREYPSLTKEDVAAALAYQEPPRPRQKRAS